MIDTLVRESTVFVLSKHLKVLNTKVISETTVFSKNCKNTLHPITVCEITLGSELRYRLIHISN